MGQRRRARRDEEKKDSVCNIFILKPPACTQYTHLGRAASRLSLTHTHIHTPSHTHIYTHSLTHTHREAGLGRVGQGGAGLLVLLLEQVKAWPCLKATQTTNWRFPV